jgi:hypothetical protein
VGQVAIMALAPFFRIGGLMTRQELDSLTIEHEHILSGVREKDGMVERFESMWKWYQQHKGKNIVFANIKDILISSGVLLVLIQYVKSIFE